MNGTSEPRNAYSARRGAAAARWTAVLAAAATLVLAGCAGSAESGRVGERAITERLFAANDVLTRPPARSATPLSSGAGSYLAGSHAQRHRDFDAAADYFTGVLAVDADNRTIRRRAYFALVASGRIEEALRLAPDIAEEDPGEAIAGLSLVVEAVRLGRFAEARKLLEAMPARGLNTFTVPLVMAWAQVGDGKIDEGLTTLSGIAEIPNLTALAEMHKGLIGDLAGRGDVAEASYRKAMARQPTLRVVEALGSFLERAGRPQDAEKAYEAFLSENPESDAFDAAFERLDEARRKASPPRIVADAREGVAEVLFNLSGTLAQGRSTDPALIYGRLALYLKPDFPIAQLLVAGILEAINRNGEAVAVYEGMDRRSPLWWAARLRKAGVLSALDRTDEAIALLGAMVDERPENTDAAIRLGDMLRSNERFAEAIDAYSTALERIATLEQRHWSLLYARGICYERTKQWPKAEHDFLKALEFSPDQPYVLNYLGYSWVDQGVHLERAREMIERAVALRPNDGYIVDSLGWALYRMGDFEGATEHLERAVTLRPEDPVINDHLGDAYWQVGRYTEARFQWRRALSLNPEESLIPLIQNKLRSGLVAKKPEDRSG
jgi:tetratricopeptide (TPR) repeat protein